VSRQVALDNQIDRLNMLNTSNPHLPFPHSSQIRGELRELRCHFGSELYRILYRRSRNLIVLLTCSGNAPSVLPPPKSQWRRSAGRTSRHAWTRPNAAGRERLGTTHPEPASS
jgi:putative component of toxin-antitoxin plasmid stabilization module